MLPFPLDKYDLLLPHKEPDQTSRGKKHLKPRSKLHKQEREGKADGRSLRSDRGVEQAGYGRADLPLGLRGHCGSSVGDPCLKFSLSDSSLFTHCLVSHLLCVRQRMGNMAIPALRSLIAHCSHHRMGISTPLQV